MKTHAKRMIKRAYAVVMDADRNALNILPRIRRFQIMTVLSVMWTTIFCAAVGAWFFYGELVIAHMLVLLGIFVTASVFHRARQRSDQLVPSAKQ